MKVSKTTLIKTVKAMEKEISLKPNRRLTNNNPKKVTFAMTIKTKKWT